MTRGIVKSSLSSKGCHEELDKGRDPMQRCREGGEVAVLSEGVVHTWYCEVLLLFREVS